MDVEVPEQVEGDQAIAVIDPLAETAWPASDPPAPVDGTGDAGCLPFDLYAPGWRAVWGQALREADPGQRAR